VITFSINPQIENNEYEFLSKYANRLYKNKTIDDTRFNEWFSRIFLNELEKKEPNIFETYEELDSYVYKCDLNTKINKSKKEINIVSFEEFETYGVGCFDDFIKCDDFVDDIMFKIDKDTLEKDLIEMHGFILVQEGVDILYLIGKLVNKDWNDNDKLVNKVVTIVRRYGLEELISEILKDKDTFIQLYKKIYEDEFFK